MNVYKVNESAELPAYATEGSACFDVKACFKRGDKLLAYNNWNKETHVAVKGVGRIADAFQIPPEKIEEWLLSRLDFCLLPGLEVLKA